MPAVPSSLSVTESPIGVALLSWEYDPLTPANFEIQRRDSISSPWSTIAISPASPVSQANHTFSDNVGLAMDVRYRIRAIDTSSGLSDWTSEVLVSTTDNLSIDVSFESYVENDCQYIMLRDTSGSKYDGLAISGFLAHYEIYDSSETLVSKTVTAVSADPTFWRPLQWSDFDGGKPREGVYRVVYYVMYGSVEVGRALGYIILGCNIERSLLDLAAKTVRIDTSCCNDPQKQDLSFLTSLWLVAIPFALKEQSLDKAEQMFERLRRELDCVC